jgi:alpha-galactosidase
MTKIAIIGAGSIVFCKTLILDVLATPGMEDVQFSLMAPSTRRTSQVADFINRVIRENRLAARVEITTNQRDALQNAQFVIATLQIGGNDAYALDIDIPLRYGVDQCIGDSMGPGGIFRAARTIPVMDALAHDMRDCCPDALLLNYVNPMAMVCNALQDAGIRSVGLCHGVQTTLDLIAGYTDVPKAEIDFLCAGINHMAWFLRLFHNGRDLYPLLRERMEKPAYYASEKVRGEVFRHTGYLMTESTGHLSEYLPWFRKNRQALDTYCDEPAFGGETGAALKFGQAVARKYGSHMLLEDEPATLPARSVEYGSHIIEALTLNRPFRFNGNVRNTGLIDNLPQNDCVEVPVLADGAGLHPQAVGALPAACAAMNLSNMVVQRMATDAARSGDPELLAQAVAMAPLTAAVLDLKEIRDMTADMLEAQRRWMPQFEGRTVRRLKPIHIPEDVQRVPVPVDPALAILARFGELGNP